MTVKNRKREEILSFEVLDELLEGLKAFHVAWTSFIEALGQVNGNFGTKR